MLAKLNFCVRNLERDRTAFRPAVPALEWRTNPAHQTSRCSNDAWHSPITVEALHSVAIVQCRPFGTPSLS